MDSNSIIVINEATNTATFWTDILLNILTGLFILLSVYLAYICGLKSYFKQCEHERIMKRYLDNGIDLVLAGINQALRVFIDNYLKAWSIIQQVSQGKKDLDVRFQIFDRNILEITPYYKLENLVGDQIFWEVSQSLFGLVDAHSSTLSAEFSESIYIKPEDKLEENKSKYKHLGEIEKYLNDSYREYKTYDYLTKELQQLASILEKQTTINWANFANFKNLPEVKDCVGKLKDFFKTKIETLKQQCEQNNK